MPSRPGFVNEHKRTHTNINENVADTRICNVTYVSGYADTQTRIGRGYADTQAREARRKKKCMCASEVNRYNTYVYAREARWILICMDRIDITKYHIFVIFSIFLSCNVLKYNVSCFKDRKCQRN